MTPRARNGRMSYETVLKRPFRRVSCAGGSKLRLGPDHEPTYTKWTEVARNLIETTSLEGFLCRGHKSKPGPDRDPRSTKWTKVARNSVETRILEGFLCRGHKTKPEARS